MATYGSLAGVQDINSHFTGGYTSTTHPTATAVSSWLAEGYALLNLALNKAGYATPVAYSNACYDILARLNNLYAAAMAEQSTNIGATAEVETRAKVLWELYKDGLTEFLSGDLTQAGLTLLSTAPVRRGLRSVQMRHYDGYAANADDDAGGYA